MTHSDPGLMFRTIDGSERPYAFLLPRPTPIAFLERVGRNAHQSLGGVPNPLHLIGVASSGVPIATAIGFYRRMTMGKHDNPPLDRLSIVEPNRLEYIDRISNYGDVTVLVDNSVKSVRTLGNVVQKLKANGIQVTYLLKLVDYQDRLEEELGEHLHSEFGIRLSNVFFITDLLSDLTPEARDLVRRHLELSGGSR